MISYKKLSRIIITEINIYIANLNLVSNNEDQQKEIVAFLYYVKSLRLHTLYLAPSIMKIVEEIFMSPALTSFVLEINNKLSSRLMYDDPGIIDKLIDILVNTITDTSINPTSSLIPEHIGSALVIKKNVLSEVLTANVWFMWIAYINMIYDLPSTKEVVAPPPKSSMRY
jgi:hypothetical protein